MNTPKSSIKWTNLDPKAFGTSKANTTTITIYRTPWLLVIALCALSMLIGFLGSMKLTQKLERNALTQQHENHLLAH